MSDPRTEVLSILAELFGARAGVDLSSLRDDSDLQAILDLDSMDVVDIAMEIENRLDVEIEGRPSDIATLGALLRRIEEAGR